MTTSKIAFIGLTRWSAALGRELAGRSAARRVLFADDPDSARGGVKSGAFSAAEWNLIAAVDGAQAVIVSGPVNRQVEWIRAIAGELAAETAVVALTPVFGQLAELRLPEGRGLALAHPLIDPGRPTDPEPEVDWSAVDLFANGAWLLACAPRNDAALALAADLARAVKAAPYFMDPAEHDLAAAGADGAPQLLAVALLAAAGRPGWAELRRAADLNFATATRASETAVPADWLANRAALAEALGAVSSELERLRAALLAEDEAALTAALAEVRDRRAAWLRSRAAGDWEPTAHTQTGLPTLGESLGRLLLGGLGRKR